MPRKASSKRNAPEKPSVEDITPAIHAAYESFKKGPLYRDIAFRDVPSEVLSQWGMFSTRTIPEKELESALKNFRHYGFLPKQKTHYEKEMSKIYDNTNGFPTETPKPEDEETGDAQRSDDPDSSDGETSDEEPMDEDQESSDDDLEPESDDGDEESSDEGSRED